VNELSLTTKILIFILFLLLLVIGWYLLNVAGSIISIFLVALVISFLLAPSVDTLERIGVPRLLGSIVMFILFFGLVSAIFYTVTPVIYEEAIRVQHKISVGALRDAIQQVEANVNEQLRILGAVEWKLAPYLENVFSAALSNILGVASGVVYSVIYVFMVVFATFFLLKDGRRIKKSLISAVPNRFFEMTLSIIHKIEWSLGAYLRGILLDAFVVGLLSTFAMWLIGVPNFMLVGFAAGMFNLVPYLGPPTGALLAIIISVVSLGTWEKTIPIILAFIALRLIDDFLVQPMTISKSVRMHPLVVIFAILAGGQFFGILGMLFAVPAVGVFNVILSEFYHGIQRYRPI